MAKTAIRYLLDIEDDMKKKIMKLPYNKCIEQYKTHNKIKILLILSKNK